MAVEGTIHLNFPASVNGNVAISQSNVEKRIGKLKEKEKYSGYVFIMVVKHYFPLRSPLKT